MRARAAGGTVSSPALPSPVALPLRERGLCCATVCSMSSPRIIARIYFVSSQPSSSCVAAQSDPVRALCRSNSAVSAST